MLAPNKKKIFGSKQPFFMINIIWKDNETKGESSNISYIQQITLFMDTIEIRIDEIILNELINFAKLI